MATVTTDDKHYKDIANVIRENGGPRKQITPAAMANCIHDACTNKYDSGFTDGESFGYSEGYPNGYETGKQEGRNQGYDEGVKAEYDRFWNSYQNNGSRTDYGYAFFSNDFNKPCWNSETFKPKYDLKPTKCARMFVNLKDFDFVERLNAHGVILDTSNSTDISYMFQNSWVYTLPTIDGSKVTSTTGYYGVFGYCRVETIQKFIVKNGLDFNNTFIDCTYLMNIIFEGEIGRSLNMAKSPLTCESMKSVISHLIDYSGTESEFLYTLTFKSDCWTALEAEGATAPNGKTWRQYAESKGWMTA